MLLKICDSFKPVFCNKTAATLLGRESQLMWYSWLWTALRGAIQAVIMVKEDKLSVLKKVSSLEKNFLEWVFKRNVQTSRFLKNPQIPYKSGSLSSIWWFKKTSESSSAWCSCWIWIQLAASILQWALSSNHPMCWCFRETSKSSRTFEKR